MLAEVAPIYRALAAPMVEIHPAGMTALSVELRRAFTPAEVDEMEIWLIADLLGIGRNDSPAAASGMTEAQFREQAVALNAERIRRAEAGLPEPEAPPSATPAVTPAMIEALAQRRREKEAAKTGA